MLIYNNSWTDVMWFVTFPVQTFHKNKINGDAYMSTKCIFLIENNSFYGEIEHDC